MAVTIDITCDLMDEEETGCIWAPLREGSHPDLIQPGAINLPGDTDAHVVPEVVDVVEKPTGQFAHLRPLPGLIEDYEALIRQAISSA